MAAERGDGVNLATMGLGRIGWMSTMKSAEGGLLINYLSGQFEGLTSLPSAGMVILLVDEYQIILNSTTQIQP